MDLRNPAELPQAKNPTPARSNPLQTPEIYNKRDRLHPHNLKKRNLLNPQTHHIYLVYSELSRPSQWKFAIWFFQIIFQVFEGWVCFPTVECVPCHFRKMIIREVIRIIKPIVIRRINMILCCELSFFCLSESTTFFVCKSSCFVFESS